MEQHTTCIGKTNKMTKPSIIKEKLRILNIKNIGEVVAEILQTHIQIQGVGEAIQTLQYYKNIVQITKKRLTEQLPVEENIQQIDIEDAIETEKSRRL